MPIQIAADLTIVTLRSAGREQQAAVWMRNLTYSGALNPNPALNADQVRMARSSALARRFGGR